MKRGFHLITMVLCICNLAIGQVLDNVPSTESQQIAVDAMLDRANKALQTNKFQEAQKILFSAKDIAIDSSIYRRTQVVEANFLSYTGQLDEAQNKVNLLKDKISQDSKSFIELLLTQADIHIKKSQYDKAEATLDKINNLINTIQAAHLDLKMQFLKANLFLKTANYNEALLLYKDIIPRLKTQRLFYFESKASFNLAETYFEKGDYENAEIAAQNSAEIAKSYGFNGIEVSSYQLTASILKGLGKFEQALAFQEKHMQLKENIRVNESKLDLLSELTKENKKLKEQQKADKKIIEEQNTKLRGSDMSSILLFVLLTLLSLLTMSLFKNNKLRARSNQALEGKNSALIDERDRAQDAAKIKADFLSTITHELRTPMYAVTGLTHLLLETEPRHDQRDHLETLQSSGEYLLSLIDNILDFNKLEANKVELEQIPFELKKRVEDITASLKNQSKDQGNSLSLEFDTTIPGRINGDPVKISQILINLVGNAIKFTKNGNIWIRVNHVKQIENKCLIHFEIEDNGKGISEEKQLDIFNNFTQEGTSTTREYGGTGLGLAIVKNLVGLMGSEIQLDSKIGRGSIFSFDLWFDIPDSNKFYDDKNLRIFDSAIEEIEEYPEFKKPVKSINPPTVKEDPVPHEKVGQSALNPEEKNKKESENNRINIEEKTSTNKSNEVIGIKKATAKDLISKKILIVEDNKINQMITRKILEGKSFDCDIANNGIEALAKIKETEYDLVLMDIHMPGMDGKQCTREVRKFDRELPIIALTAVTLDESMKEFYEIGFDDIIPKPFKMEEFFEKIQKTFTNYQIY